MAAGVLSNLIMKNKGQALTNDSNTTYIEDKKDLSMVHLQSFTIDTCGCDEGHYLDIIENGTKASRHHSHIKELRWHHTNIIG